MMEDKFKKKVWWEGWMRRFDVNDGWEGLMLRLNDKDE